MKDKSFFGFLSSFDRRSALLYIAFGIIALYVFPEQFFGHPEAQWIKTYLQFTFPLTALLIKVATDRNKSEEDVRAEIAGIAQFLVGVALFPNLLIIILGCSLIFIVPTQLLWKAGVPGPLAFSIVIFGFLSGLVLVVDRRYSGKSR